MRVPFQDVQQIEERAITPVRYDLPSEAPMEGVGRALQEGGKLLDIRAREMQEEEDAAVLTETFASASDQLRPVLHGDILARQGKNAFSAYDDAAEVMKKIGEEAEANLSTEHQKMAFRQMWLKNRAGNLNTVARHVATQRQAYRKNVAAAAQNSALEDIAANYADPELVAEHMQRSERMIRANYLGQAPEFIDAKIGQFRSKVHSVVIERMIEADPMAANAYYKEHKSEIDGLTQMEIEKDISGEVEKAQARNYVDKIMGLQMSERDALAKARKDLSGDVQDKAVQRIRARYNEAGVIEFERVRRNANEANQIIMQGGTPDDFRPALTRNLTAAQINNYWEGTERRQAGTLGETSSRRYTELVKMATSPDAKKREAFAKMPLEVEYPLMTDEHWKKLRTMQRSIVTSGVPSAKMSAISSAMARSEERLNRFMSGMNEKKAKKTKDTFERVLLGRIEELQDAEDRRATNSEIDSMLNDLFMEVSVKDSGLFSDTRKRKFELQPGEEGYIDVDYNDVPEDFITELNDWWTKQHKAGNKPRVRPTMDEVVDTYKLHLHGNSR